MHNKAYTLIGVLPDAHALLRSQVQCIALRDIKRLIELINIAHHTVHAELIRRMWIHRNHHLSMLRAGLRAPAASIREEETLNSGRTGD